MGTRCRAYIETRPEGKQPYFKGISIHFDGYPSGVGATLLAHYNSAEKFNELLDSLGGYIVSLEDSLEATIKDNETTERGDYLQADYSDPIKQSNFTNRPFVEFVYIFKDGKWYYFTCGILEDDKDGELIELTEQAIKDYEGRI